MKKFITIAAAAAFLFAGNISANAQESQAELLAKLATLQAQLAALSGGSSVTASGSLLSDYNGVNIRIGSRGPRVSELQACMNAAGYNTGVVDGIYGPNTAAGVKAFQASKGLVVDGIVGVRTTPAFQAACPVATTTTTTTTVVETEVEPSVSRFDTNDGEEADFTDFEVEDADDDTIEEGENKAELAEIEFELEEGGAALLERLDVILDYTGGGTVDEDDAWDTFDTIYVMVDGDIIAEVDADDEDDWEDRSTDTAVGDDNRLRITGINHVFDAEEEHVVVIAADITGSLDLDAGGAEWTLTVDETALRFVDEAGITVYLSEEDAPATDETATFTIEEEGQDDELDVKSSSNDPDSTTLKVEDDEASDDYTVFVFELEADEDSSDLDVDKVAITVNTTGGDYNNIVKDEEIVIDGESFDDVEVTIVSSTEALLVFDVDEDFTIEADETVDVELVLEFKAANSSAANYAPGATVQAQVSSDDASLDNSDITAEGAETVIANGTATGDIHELLVEGINTEKTGSSRSLVSVDGANDDFAEFELVIDVTAFEENAFISEDVAGFSYSIVGTEAGGAPFLAANAGVASLSSDATQEGTRYRVDENDTEEFVLSVTFDPTNDGSYRLRLDSVQFFATNAGGTATTYATLPVEDYRTGFINIID